MTLPAQRIHEGPQHAFRGAIVDAGANAAQVTQCLVQPVRNGVEDEPLVIGSRCSTERNRKAKLEGHVEPRSTRRRSVQRHPRQIVKRKLRTDDQLVNALELESARRVANSRRGHETVSRNTSDERQIDLLVGSSVRKIDERDRRVRALRAHPFTPTSSSRELSQHHSCARSSAMQAFESQHRPAACRATPVTAAEARPCARVRCEGGTRRHPVLGNPR